MKHKTNFGNWIPVKIIIIPLLLSLIIFCAAILVSNVYVRIIAGAFSTVFLIFSLYFLYAFWLLGRNKRRIQMQFYEALIERLEWDGNGKAIDIGTGNGPVPILLANKYPHAKVTGIDQWVKVWDYSKGICEQNARLEGLSDRVVFSKGSAVNIPYADAEFDAVTSNFVFHTIKADDRKNLIKEALRILKPGGAFAFQDLFSREFYGNIDSLIRDIKSWKLKKVEFIRTSSIFKVPVALRIKFIVGDSGILYGIK